MRPPRPNIVSFRGGAPGLGRRPRPPRRAQGATRLPVSGLSRAAGGTPAGNAFADADSFAQVCAFVERATRVP